MTVSRFSFENDAGHSLAARLEEPDEMVRAYAVFAHCFTCSKDIAAASRISRALVARGIAVLRFDFTGIGNSEGDFANSNFTSDVADLVAAARHLRATKRAPALLIGHSLGGAAVLAAAAALPEVKAVATLGAPSDPEHVAELFTDVRAEIEATGCAVVKLGGRDFSIKKQFLEDIAEHNLTRSVAELNRALLVMHSPTDIVVGIEHAGKLFGSARHPKSFVSLAGADHLLSDKRDSEYAAQVIAAWADRYLGD